MEEKILIACECSGTVRDAFVKAGFNAFSVDMKPDVNRSNRHYQADVMEILPLGWDALIVCHPPCTRLCNSGVRWLNEPSNELGDAYDDETRAAFKAMDRDAKLKFLWDDLDRGAKLFSDLWNADAAHGIKHIAIENPVMHKHAKARIENYEPFSQSVQPWQFAEDTDSWDNTKKRTCWWTKNLPKLTPTGTLDGSCAKNSIHMMAKSATRSADRAKFFPSMARAIANQWGGHVARQYA